MCTILPDKIQKEEDLSDRWNMCEALERNGLKCLNVALPENCEAKLVADEGRIYYVE